jgi:transcriptional regulator with XRE-family HTH domain
MSSLLSVSKANGFSQEALANELGFPLSQIGRMERGELNSSISHVSAVANALNVSLKDLFDFQ